MSKTDIKDTPEQKIIFNIGMHYTQMIQKCRLAGNEKMANYFSKEFLNLCKSAIEDPHNASKIIEDDIMRSLNTVNAGRLGLRTELSRAKADNNQTAIKIINEANQKVDATCEILTYCLQNHCPPPPIEKQQASYRQIVIDNSIPDDVLRLKITGLGLTEKKSHNSQYSLKITPPGRDQFATDIFNPDKVEFNYDFKIVKRAQPARILKLLKKSLEITLSMHTKSGLAKKEKETDVAHLEIPMTVFSENKHVSNTYIMQSLPDAPKKEQYSLKIEILLSASLKGQEYSDRYIEYYTIQQGSKLVFPWETPPRELSSLSKEEVMKISPELIPMPKIEDLPFMSKDWLKHLMDLMQHNIDTFNKYNVIVPPKVIEKRDMYKNKLLALLKSMKDGKLSIEKYVQALNAVTLEQIKMVKALKPEQMSLRPEYLERIKVFKADIDSMKEKLKSKA